MDRRSVSNAAAKYVVNPVMRRVAGIIPGWALLETTGRKSGHPRRTPVGDGLRGNTFWIVAEHGHSADYVKNIKANPKVRVRTHGRWRIGTAHVQEDDDAAERQRQLRLNPLNAAMIRAVGTDLLTIRIDLESEQ